MNPFEGPLRDLEARDRLRSLSAPDGLPGKHVVREGRRCLNLSSNNYLGLADHPLVKQAGADALLRYGAGAGGSRLLGGGLALHRELESAVADMRPLGKALLFNTGFMANLGVLQALAPLLGPVYSDKLNHASVAEALRARPNAFHRYRHRDLAHLESLLAAHADPGARGAETASGSVAVSAPGLVCSETLFSMDGDFAPLEGLLALQERFGFYLYLDEAHSTGCCPETVSRALAAGAASGKVLIMGTFGKAYGGFGAYVAGPAQAIDYLVNAARSFIFSTALPPAAAAAALAALKVAESEPWRREKLAATAAFARGLFRGRGFDIGASESHIVPVLAGSDRAAVRLSEALFHAGYHAPPVRHPTVPQGKARLRINLTCEISPADVAALADALSAARDVQSAARDVQSAARDAQSAARDASANETADG
ncbi:MAG TPA: aminotransferase class I/II-fold pyridoxal phosphate-dependent enzyme [Fibrobacteria bacterium]|nr:aminotransferase class I/II-fold pyridoxal phosphate-dependent enzyme [Fibrobacteria bacterium]